jgi:hypothetical protein
MIRMEISRKDAAEALRDVAQAQAHAGEIRGYHFAAPYLIGWGLIWAIGYALMAIRPQSEWGLIWLPLDAIGIIGSIVRGRRDARRISERRPDTARVIAGVAFIALFMAATYMIFQPTAVAPFVVFPGMIAGAIYVAIGLARMPRLGWIGFVIFALSVAGYFFAGPALLYWMAITGGGGLILSGLWLRSA